jgi:triosephosphate isomerase
MKPRYFIGNLKMNPVSADGVSRYLEGLREECTEGLPEGVALSIMAPFVYLDRFAGSLPKGATLGAQDVFWEREGSYTGEISAAMLRDIGVKSVLIGHSERRRYGRETDDEIGRKVEATLHEGLRPVLCVGETAEEREAGQESDVLKGQISSALRDITSSNASKIMVAYEPRWAIGSDRTPSSEEILSARIVIRRALLDRFDENIVDSVPILYGGSVQASLLPEVCFDTEMDGVLVGRESLHPHEVGKMIRMLGEREVKETDEIVISQ